METNKCRVAVVIVTYNRCSMLLKTLEYLLCQSFSPLFVVLIDNCSTDDTMSSLVRCGYIPNTEITPLEKYSSKKANSNNEKVEIIYQRQPVNIGGSGGFHEGLKLAVSLPVEWVWIMDDDAFPEKSALLKLVEHTGDNGVVALSSVVKNKKGEIDIVHRKRIEGKLSRFVPVGMKEYYKETFDYDIFSYVGTLLKKDCIKEIGLPYKKFFIFYDDTEHSLRVNKRGIIRNINSSIINHQVVYNRSNRMKSSWKTYYQYRNMLIVRRLHFSPVIWLYDYFVTFSKFLTSLLLFKISYSKQLIKAMIDSLNVKKHIDINKFG